MTDLIHRLKAATGPSRELDAEIAKAAGFEIEIINVPDGHPLFKSGSGLEFMVKDDRRTSILPYTESIDAALTLLTWKTSWNIGSYLDQYVASVGDFTEPGANPAIAIVIAILKEQEHRA
jgi:hypothetical protein